MKTKKIVTLVTLGLILAYGIAFTFVKVTEIKVYQGELYEMNKEKERLAQENKELKELLNKRNLCSVE